MRAPPVRPDEEPLRDEPEDPREPELPDEEPPLLMEMCELPERDEESPRDVSSSRQLVPLDPWPPLRAPEEARGLSLVPETEVLPTVGAEPRTSAPEA